jgi:uncharacterized spore protein YtfJ
MSPEKITDRPVDTAVPSPPLDRVSRVMERLLEAADVTKVYGEPIAHGEALLIPAAEVVVSAGFGMGSGGGVSFQEQGQKSRGSGGEGGGGGKTLARSVAVIVASPDGVVIRPVVDFTKIALAALTAAGFVMAAGLVMAAWKGMKRPKGLFRG